MKTTIRMFRTAVLAGFFGCFTIAGSYAICKMEMEDICIKSWDEY